MAQGVTTLAVVFCLPLLATGTAFPQASPTPSRVSDVYVGTPNGVYVYHAASNGSLSPVPGSPYPIAGTAIGSNHKYFFSSDPNYLHSYSVASNGAIKSQASQINTQKYSGSECGTIQGAVLDHTGQDLYAQLYGDSTGGSDGPCVALQSLKISTTGAFTFLGATQFDTELTSGLGGFSTPIKLSGNNKDAYSGSYDHECYFRIWELHRESSGAMMYNTYQILDIAPTTRVWRWYPWFMTSDPTNHMAVAMYKQGEDGGPCGYTTFLNQLASFTVAPDGTLSTTLTQDKMPTPKIDPQVLNMSPSGLFLAAGGNKAFNASKGTQTPGLQVFHFNGANPVTPYSGVLTTAPIDQINWDRNDHLFALSNSTHKLYVYTVTSSSITAAPGSPFTIPSAPNALSVVPLMCSAPSTPGVHICTPSGGSTVGSPVLVEASANVSGKIASMELWIDGAKKYTTHSPQLDTTVKLASGKHHFSVFAVNTDGQKWNNAVYATVK